MGSVLIDHSVSLNSTEQYIHMPSPFLEVKAMPH